MDQTTAQITLPHKARVFLVEDEAIVVEALKQRLTRAGYEVIGTASSGNQAIEQIKKLQPDLVIMDVRITGDLNGIEVAIIIQSYFNDLMPVIFLTGFSADTFTYLKALGDYIYLNKPFTESVLLDAVERALQKND